MDYPTTPFGRRPMTLGQVASQSAARACPETKTVHKWKVFRWITEGKESLGLSDRTLSVLNALLTCLPETAMTAGSNLTVFPSNAQLALRAHGMAESTLRRHLHALAGAGLIIRRDSPNGKRYARRGRAGDIELAFGFDLTPLVVRADALERMADEARQRRLAIVLARERITILRRDIGKMLVVGIASGIEADWVSIRVAFASLRSRLPRIVTPEVLEPLAADLHALAVWIGNMLESHAVAQDMSGNDAQPDAHYLNSKTDVSIDLEPAIREGQGATVEQTERRLPLGAILKACPDIALYDRNGIRSWRDLIATAGMVRGMLGISPSAWDGAREALGDIDAAVTVAAILQRAEEIKSPGGYLRGLTIKAQEEKFS